jgi:hypothetical protein
VRAILGQEPDAAKSSDNNQVDGRRTCEREGTGFLSLRRQERSRRRPIGVGGHPERIPPAQRLRRRRLAYALSRVVVTRKDDGRNTFNSSLVLSTVLAKSLSNAYYPQSERGFSHTMNRVEGSLLGSVQGYLLREFLPDILGMCRKHESKWLKAAERKLPFSRRFDPDAYPDLAPSPQETQGAGQR